MQTESRPVVNGTLLLLPTMVQIATPSNLVGIPKQNCGMVALP
jgi:hypothetical protein